MVNKTFLPPFASAEKHLTPSKITKIRLGTAFAEKTVNASGLGEPKAFTEVRKDDLGEFSQRTTSGEHRRCRIRFSSDYRGK